MSNMNREEVIALICRHADGAGLPREFLLGVAIAESALNPSARRPKDASQDATYFPDVSFGLFQQTARWADEGDQSPRADNIRFIEELYSDPEHAAKVATRKLKHYYEQEGGDALAAACRYNWPALDPKLNPNRGNYMYGLAEARAILSRAATPNEGSAMRLSEILARGRSRIGDPYVWGGKAPPNTDCSGFAAWCYNGKITSYTDAVLNETERVASPAPGDIVLYEYRDASQPGVRFPHMGLFISDGVTLDNRHGHGVGEHPQLPRSQAARYYRRLPGVIVDTDGSVAPPPPPAADPRDVQIADLKRQLDEERTKLGVASVDYADGLQDIVNALRNLKPA